MIENKTPEIGKEETVEEAAEKKYPTGYKNMFDGMNIGKIQRNAFIQGFQYQKETTYTKQQVLAFGEMIKELAAKEADDGIVDDFMNQLQHNILSINTESILKEVKK